MAKKQRSDKRSEMVLFVMLGILIIAALMVTVNQNRKPVTKIVPPQGSTYTFVCDGKKSILATFYPTNDVKVDLVLSDGRKMSLDHVVSANGARYANKDESIVFWNVGNTAFMTEGNKNTYDGCVQQ